MGISVIPPSRRAGALLQSAQVRPSSPPQSLVVWPADGLRLSAKRRSYRACYERFIPLARAWPVQQVLVFRGNAGLVLANVRFGLDSACVDRAAVERDLPHADLPKALETPDLARSLVYAVGRVVEPVSEGEVKRRIAAIKTVREPMADAARNMALKNVIPAKSVPEVRKGGGVPAVARHAVDLAELFTAHAERMRGSHPFTDEDVRTLHENGEWLMENLKPTREPSRKVSRANSPADDRDRLWTLLTVWHVELRRIGGYFHPNTLDQVVPPLLSAAVVKRADDETDDEEAPTEPAKPA